MTAGRAVDKGHTVGRGVKVNRAAAESGVLNIRDAGGSGSRTGAPQYDSALVVFNMQKASFESGRETWKLAQDRGSGWTGLPPAPAPQQVVQLRVPRR